MAYESGYKTTLAVEMNAVDVTMTVATAPTVTAGRIFLDNGAQQEWMSFTGVTDSTLTGLTRGLSKTADPVTAGSGKDWMAGTTVRIVAMHDQMLDKTLALTGTKVYYVSDTSGGAVTRKLTFINGLLTSET